MKLTQRLFAAVITLGTLANVIAQDIAPADAETNESDANRQLQQLNALREATTNQNDADQLASIYQARIVGGTLAKIDYPFMAWDGGCGGSLVAKNVILTAAHCGDRFSKNAYVGGSVRYGGQNIAAEKVVVHPQYRVGGSQNNDFMLIKLTSEARTNNIIQLNLDKNFPADGSSKMLTTIGFGATSESGSSSNQLREVDVPYVDHDVCRVAYGSVIREDIMLCAGLQRGGKDACQGDSGGPIFEKKANGVSVQVGVTSFGAGCARAGKPGVYARTSGVSTWLKNEICNMATTKPAYLQCGGGGNTNNGAVANSAATFRVEYSLGSSVADNRIFVKDVTTKDRVYLKKSTALLPNRAVRDECALTPGKEYILNVRDLGLQGLGPNQYVAVTRTKNGRTELLATVRGAFSGKKQKRRFIA